MSYIHKYFIKILFRCYSTKEKLILKTDINGIRTLKLNDTKTRNTLSMAMLTSLQENLLINDESTKCIILEANGNVFSSGHNLKELTSSSGSIYHSELFNKCSKLMTYIQEIPVPVIAKVNGLAAAAGCQLVASCDIVVASHNASFSTPGTSNGLFCSTPGVALSRAVPLKVALYMLLTGLRITAQEAAANGLVSKLVSEDKLDEQVLLIAEEICKKSKEVTAFGKKIFYKQIIFDYANAYELANEAMVENLKHADASEGIDAFINKRKPKFMS